VSIDSKITEIVHAISVWIEIGLIYHVLALSMRMK